MIRFKCLGCNAMLECRDNKAGTKIACPKCQQKLTVPQAQPKDVGTFALAEDDELKPALPAVDIEPQSHVSKPRRRKQTAPQSDVANEPDDRIDVTYQGFWSRAWNDYRNGGDWEMLVVYVFAAFFVPVFGILMYFWINADVGSILLVCLGGGILIALVGTVVVLLLETILFGLAVMICRIQLIEKVSIPDVVARVILGILGAMWLSVFVFILCAQTLAFPPWFLISFLLPAWIYNDRLEISAGWSLLLSLTRLVVAHAILIAPFVAFVLPHLARATK